MSRATIVTEGLLTLVPLFPYRIAATASLVAGTSIFALSTFPVFKLLSVWGCLVGLLLALYAEIDTSAEEF